MSANGLSAVLVQGAWADGLSWSKIIAPLVAESSEVAAAPLPLTSFKDDVEALDRALERVKAIAAVRAQRAYR
jgi:ubiquinone biosynthesis protein UbiJ